MMKFFPALVVTFFFKKCCISATSPSVEALFKIAPAWLQLRKHWFALHLRYSCSKKEDPLP